MIRSTLKPLALALVLALGGVAMAPSASACGGYGAMLTPEQELQGDVFLYLAQARPEARLLSVGTPVRHGSTFDVAATVRESGRTHQVRVPVEASGDGFVVRHLADAIRPESMARLGIWRMVQREFGAADYAVTELSLENRWTGRANVRIEHEDGSATAYPVMLSMGFREFDAYRLAPAAS